MSRFPLRAKLALFALALLVLPWAGWRYVREMDRFLLAAQEETLAASARCRSLFLQAQDDVLPHTLACMTTPRRWISPQRTKQSITLRAILRAT